LFIRFDANSDTTCRIKEGHSAHSRVAGVNEGEGSAGIVARQPFQDGIAPATSPDRQMSSGQNASSYSHRREKETVVFQRGSQTRELIIVWLNQLIVTFLLKDCRHPIAFWKISGTKKPPFGGFTTLLIALIILLFPHGTRSGT